MYKDKKVAKKSYSFRLSFKNRIYFQILGFIDKRNGNLRNSEHFDFSTFINEIITYHLENGNGNRFHDLMPPDILARNFLKERIKENNVLIQKLEADNHEKVLAIRSLKKKSEEGGV